MLFYLSPEKARNMMIERGIFTADNAPTLDKIESVNSILQAVLDEWLGYSAIAQEYTDRRESNRSGILVLTNHPVIQVTRIKIMHHTSSSQEYILNEKEINLAWRFRDRRIMTEMWFQRLTTVDYIAGLDPLPPVFEVCAFNLLKAALFNPDPWDMNFLYQPTKDVTSVSLGGLSQGFKMSDTKDVRHIDRLLQPLQRYRRRIIGC
jgi:hypothetical protein